MEKIRLMAHKLPILSNISDEVIEAFGTAQFEFSFRPMPYIIPQSHYDDLCDILGCEPAGIIRAKRIGEAEDAR